MSQNPPPVKPGLAETLGSLVLWVFLQGASLLFRFLLWCWNLFHPRRPETVEPPAPAPVPVPTCAYVFSPQQNAYRVECSPERDFTRDEWLLGEMIPLWDGAPCSRCGRPLVRPDLKGKVPRNG